MRKVAWEAHRRGQDVRQENRENNRPDPFGELRIFRIKHRLFYRKTSREVRFTAQKSRRSETQQPKTQDIY